MKTPVPTIVGLGLALGGPALLAGFSNLLGDPGLATKLLGQLVLWLLFIAILAVVMLWERQPLTSIGVQRVRWQSFAWGLLLTAVLVLLVSPITIWALGRIGIAGFAGGLLKLLALPVWFRVLAVVTGGIVEETLYRGYAVERLSWLTGSDWWGGLIACTAFALAHLPFWGVGPVLSIFVSGGLLTMFYVWQRDLLANCIAHVLTDGIGIVVMPLLGGA